MSSDDDQVGDDESADRGEPEDTDPDEGGGIDRRLILAGAVAGAAGASGGLYFGHRRISSRGEAPLKPSDREAAYTPADAGGFTSREESFVAGGEDAPSAQGRLVWDTPEEAARNTEVTVSTILATDDPVLHLLRRTTFGPAPALVAEVHTRGINAWLAEQLNPTAIADEDAEQVRRMFPLAGMSPAQIQQEVETRQWDAMAEYGKATVALQTWSKRQLYEVMVDFWANHLNVPVPGAPEGWDVGPSYHNEVIRLHALGSFTNMLLAAMRHPAMLRYLSNAPSNKQSVNENLGRELLELHTVGVGGGYNEADVRNSAHILTGRTVTREDDDRGPWGSFVYDPDMHWTGQVQVLGFQHDNSSAAEGLEVGDAYLRYLASHPSTARTIARKLVVRFVSDKPSAELVDSLAMQYLESDTEILPVLDLLFRSSDFWAAVGQKTRRPLENMVASIRALGVRPSDTRSTAEAFDGIYHWATRMGHRPLAWRPPDGYPDVYPPWRSASGMLEVWNTHRRLLLRWRDELRYTPTGELTGDLPRGTVGEYVDSLCRRLCLQTFQPEHRDALIAFVGSDASTPSHQAGLDDDVLVEHLAALVLDSPYFSLR